MRSGFSFKVAPVDAAAAAEAEVEDEQDKWHLVRNVFTFIGAGRRRWSSTLQGGRGSWLGRSSSSLSANEALLRKELTLDQARGILGDSYFEWLSKAHLSTLVNGQDAVAGEAVQDTDLTLSELASTLRLIVGKLLASKENARLTLLEVFGYFDKHDQDGKISSEEFSECVNQLFNTRFNNETLSTLFRSIDTNMSGDISFQEFLQFFTLNKHTNTFSASMPETVTCVTFSKDGKFLAHGGLYGVGVVDSSTGTVIFEHQTRDVKAIALSSDGSILYVGHWTGSSAVPVVAFVVRSKKPPFASSPPEVAGKVEQPAGVAQLSPLTVGPNLRINGGGGGGAGELKQEQNEGADRGDRPIASARTRLLPLLRPLPSTTKTATVKQWGVAEATEEAQQVPEVQWQEHEPILSFDLPGKVESLALSEDNKFLVGGGSGSLDPSMRQCVARLWNAKTGDLLAQFHYPAKIMCVAVARVPLLTVAFAIPVGGIDEWHFSEVSLLTTHLLGERGSGEKLCLNLTGSRGLPRFFAASVVEDSVIDCAALESRIETCTTILCGVVKTAFSERMQRMTVRLDAATMTCLQSGTRVNSEAEHNSEARPVVAIAPVFEFDPRQESTRCQSWSTSTSLGTGEDYARLQAGTRVMLSVRGTLRVHSHKNVVAVGGEANLVSISTFSTVKSRGDQADRLVRFRAAAALQRTTEALAGLRRGTLQKGESTHALNMTSMKQAFESDYNNHGYSTKFEAFIQAVHSFELDTGATVLSLSLSGDAEKIAIGGGNPDVVLLNTAPQREEEVMSFRFDQHAEGVCLSHDGRVLAVCGNKGRVSVFDLSTGCCDYDYECEARRRLCAVSFGGADQNDGSCVAFGGFNNTVRCESFRSGVGFRAYPGKAVVNSVSLSYDGNRIAIGTKDGGLRVMDCKKGSDIRNWEAKGGGWTYVALSRNGKIVVSGNYEGLCSVRAVDTDELLHEHHFAKPTPAPNFVWAVAISEDMSVVAAGSWTGEVRVWRFGSFDLVCAPIIRPDRANSVALSSDGLRLLVGCRDGSAVLYALPKVTVRPRTAEQFTDALNALPTATVLFEATFPDRIYSVTLTKTCFALAGMHREIFIFREVRGSTGSYRLVHRFPVANAINAIAFSPDGQSLAAGGEDMQVQVWSIDDSANFGAIQVLLCRRRVVSSVCFSSGQLCFGVNRKAVTYGASVWASASTSNSASTFSSKPSSSMSSCHNTDCSWKGQPEFEVVADSLGTSSALAVMKRNFRHCSSICSPHTGESVLQRCVLLHTDQVLKALLKGDTNVGFVRDSTGNTALMVALILEKRRCVETLLHAVTSGRVSTSSLSSVAECFPMLHSAFPELLLEFCCNMQLADARGIDASEDTVQNGAHQFSSGMIPFIAPDFHICSRDLLNNNSDESRPLRWEQYVRGTSKRTEPRNLWEDVYTGARLARGRVRGSTRDGEKRVEMIAKQNPFEKFVGWYEDAGQSPFHLITSAARKLNSFAVFESDIMRSAIQFKWEMFAHSKFEHQFMLFGALLLLVIIFSVSASRSLKVKGCGLLEFYFPRSFPGSCEEVMTTYLRLAWLFFPLAFCSNIYFLLAEVYQLSESIQSYGTLASGLSHYFSSIWNYLDIVGFGLQVVAQTLWVCNQEGVPVANETRVCLGIACFLMSCKTMYFARGYATWGPMVRMITEIIFDMGPFLAIIVWFLAGFSLALLIINEEVLPFILIWNSKRETICDEGTGEGDEGTSEETCSCRDGECNALSLFFEYLQFMFTTGLYGDPSSYFTEGVHPTRANQIIFNLSLLLIQIILLNLVIAVMGATYGRVESQRNRQSLFERASIIVEVEETWKPETECINMLTRIEAAVRLSMQKLRGNEYKEADDASDDQGRQDPKEGQGRRQTVTRNWSALDSMEERIANRRRETLELLFPRWLQMLVPRSGMDRGHTTGGGGGSGGGGSGGGGGGGTSREEAGGNNDDIGAGSNVAAVAPRHQQQFQALTTQLEQLKKTLVDLDARHESERRELRDMLRVLLKRQEESESDDVVVNEE